MARRRATSNGRQRRSRSQSRETGESNAGRPVRRPSRSARGRAARGGRNVNNNNTAGNTSNNNNNNNNTNNNRHFNSFSPSMAARGFSRGSSSSPSPDRAGSGGAGGGGFGRPAGSPEADSICVICHSRITDLSITNCEHRFCRDCIRRWTRQSGSCPTCRAAVHTIRNILPDGGTEIIEISRAELVAHKVNEMHAILMLLFTTMSHTLLPEVSNYIDQLNQIARELNVPTTSSRTDEAGAAAGAGTASEPSTSRTTSATNTDSGFEDSNSRSSTVASDSTTATPPSTPLAFSQMSSKAPSGGGQSSHRPATLQGIALRSHLAQTLGAKQVAQSSASAPVTRPSLSMAGQPTNASAPTAIARPAPVAATSPAPSSASSDNDLSPLQAVKQEAPILGAKSAPPASQSRPIVAARILLRIPTQEPSLRSVYQLGAKQAAQGQPQRQQQQQQRQQQQQQQQARGPAGLVASEHARRFFSAAGGAGRQASGTSLGGGPASQGHNLSADDLRRIAEHRQRDINLLTESYNKINQIYEVLMIMHMIVHRNQVELVPASSDNEQNE